MRGGETPTPVTNAGTNTLNTAYNPEVGSAITAIVAPPAAPAYASLAMPATTLTLPAPPRGSYIPLSIDFPASIPKGMLIPYLQYITQLNDIQQYTIAQYTFHGDIILNALLRGIDTIDTYRDNIATPDTIEGDAHYFEPSCLFLYLLAPDLARNEYFKTVQPKLHRVTYYLMNYNARPDGQILNHWDESVKATNFRRGVSTAEFRAHKNEVFTRYRTSIYPELKAHLDAGDLNYFREKTYEAFKLIFGAIQGITRYIPFDPMDPPRKFYRGVRHFYIPRELRPFAINSFLSTSIDESVAINFADRATGGLYEFHCFFDVRSLYLASLSRFPREFEMLFCPGIKLQYMITTTKPDGLKVDTYVILKPDERSSVGTTVPETYGDYMRWESSLEVGRTPVGPARGPQFLDLSILEPQAVAVPIEPAAAPLPLLPASPLPNALPSYSPFPTAPADPFENNSNFNLYAGGARRRRTRRGGGTNPKRMHTTKTSKKLNTAVSKQQRNTAMSEKPVSIPGDRWDSKLPIKYQLLDLTKEDEKTLAHIKEYIFRKEKKEYHDI